MLLCSELAPKFSLVVRDCMGWDLASLSKTHFLMRLRFSFMIAEISGQLQLRPGTQADGCGHQRGPCIGCSEDSLGGKGVVWPGTNLKKSPGLFTSAQPPLKHENVCTGEMQV